MSAVNAKVNLVNIEKSFQIRLFLYKNLLHSLIVRWTSARIGTYEASCCSSSESKARSPVRAKLRSPFGGAIGPSERRGEGEKEKAYAGGRSQNRRDVLREGIEGGGLRGIHRWTGHVKKMACVPGIFTVTINPKKPQETY